MPIDERLTGKIEVRDSASRELRDIAGSFRDVASSAVEAASATEVAGQTFDETEDEASGLSRALESVARSASSVSGSMGSVGGASEAGEEGLEDAKQEARGLNRQLSLIPTTVAAASASLMGLRGTTIGYNVGVHRDTPQMDTDFLGDMDGLGRVNRKLRETTVVGKAAAESVDDVDDETRGLIDTVIASSTGLTQFQNRLDETGDEAQQAGRLVKRLSKRVRNLSISQVTASATSQTLAGRLDEVGDEATQAARKMLLLDGTTDSMLTSLGRTATHIGPFRTSLQSLVSVAPLIASLAASLGGLATAAAGMGGALAGIFGGGLLKAGEDLADQMIATGEASEQMMEAEGSEKAILGLQEILGNLKEDVYEALSPLRQPEFAQFSLDVLEGAIDLLGRISEGIDSISDPVLGWTSEIGDAFWDELPEIGDEMRGLLMEFGPALRDISIGAIERLPGLLRVMREQGEDVIPLLMDFTGALMDVMPVLAEVGTMMVRGILPNLTGFLKGVDSLSDEIIYFARIIGDVLAILDPFIEDLFAIGGAAAVVANVIPFLAWSLRGLRMITSVLVFQPIISAILTIGKVAIGAKASVLGLVGALGVLGSIVTLGVFALAAGLTYLDAWDDAIVGLIDLWNNFLDAMQSSAEVAAQAMESIVNTAADAINWLIKQANRVPTVDIEPVDTDYSVDVGYEDQKIDPERGRRMGEKLNDPVGAMTPRIPEPDSSSSFGGDNYDYSTNNDVTVNVDGDGDEQRIETAVRRGVKQANRRDRLKNSDLN